jgi:hypothetical protein
MNVFSMVDSLFAIGQRNHLRGQDGATKRSAVADMAQCGQALPQAGLLALGEALTPQEIDQLLVLGPVLHHHGGFIMPRQVPVSRKKSAPRDNTTAPNHSPDRWIVIQTTAGVQLFAAGLEENVPRFVADLVQRLQTVGREARQPHEDALDAGPRQLHQHIGVIMSQATSIAHWRRKRTIFCPRAMMHLGAGLSPIKGATVEKTTGRQVANS